MNCFLRLLRMGKETSTSLRLMGEGTRNDSTSPATVCIAVLDPAFAPASGTKQWILDQLDVGVGGGDTSVIASDRLKQWKHEFSTLNFNGVDVETIFFQKFVLLRLHPKDLHKVAPAVTQLATRLRVGLLFFENCEWRK
jgi:hypothetical protein